MGTIFNKNIILFLKRACDFLQRALMKPPMNSRAVGQTLRRNPGAVPNRTLSRGPGGGRGDMQRR